MSKSVFAVAAMVVGLSARACTGQGIGSDDFSGDALAELWTLEGPAGTAEIRVDGGESFLELAVPEGKHDVWNSNDGARLLQTAPDGDFQVEAKFLSDPSERYQIQGIQVIGGDGDWIRFDTYSDGNSLRVFSAVIAGGTPETSLRGNIDPGQARHLRVTRSGDIWTLDVSANGTDWTTAGSFEHALAVSRVGPFAASVGPGHVAQVDYFFNTADPIANEDGAADG